jgi:Ras-related protein Rap-1A
LLRNEYRFFEVPLILVGNKSDLAHERAVLYEEGQTMANEFNCTFVESSAKRRINVYEVGKWYANTIALEI